jgi:hypothetical protein
VEDRGCTRCGSEPCDRRIEIPAGTAAHEQIGIELAGQTPKRSSSPDDLGDVPAAMESFVHPDRALVCTPQSLRQSSGKRAEVRGPHHARPLELTGQRLEHQLRPPDLAALMDEDDTR